MKEYKPIYPKSRYKGKESDLQKIVFRFLAHYPKIFAFHVKNEGISGNAGKWYGANKAKEGVVSGIPDILIIQPTNIYHGMAVELKAGYGQMKKSQVECMKNFHERGWYTCVCWSLDDFEHHFNQYLDIKIYLDNEKPISKGRNML